MYIYLEPRLSYSFACFGTVFIVIVTAMVNFHLAIVAALLPTSLAWWPGHKLRGVNLGSLFVFEPWIATTEWSNIGCGGQRSEFDCVMNTGQARSDAAFQRHWNSWITQADLDEMVSYGINTIRVPLGYWLREDLVYDSEHFPRASFIIFLRLVQLTDSATRAPSST